MYTVHKLSKSLQRWLDMRLVWYIIIKSKIKNAAVNCPLKLVTLSVDFRLTGRQSSRKSLKSDLALLSISFKQLQKSVR